MRMVALQVIIPVPDYNPEMLDRDDLEDALDEVLSHDEIGRVTGGRASTAPHGLPSVIVEIEIVDEARAEEAARLLLRVLRRLRAPMGTKVVGPGAEYPVYTV
jgi:hypothetical protein